MMRMKSLQDLPRSQLSDEHAYRGKLGRLIFIFFFPVETSININLQLLAVPTQTCTLQCTVLGYSLVYWDWWISKPTLSISCRTALLKGSLTIYLDVIFSRVSSAQLDPGHLIAVWKSGNHFPFYRLIIDFNIKEKGNKLYQS